MPSNESKWVLVRPRSAAFLFILPMNDFTRAERVSPVPKVSARAYAASQPEGSINAYSNCRTVTRSPVLRSAVLAPSAVT